MSKSRKLIQYFQYVPSSICKFHISPYTHITFIVALNCVHQYIVMVRFYRIHLLLAVFVTAVSAQTPPANPAPTPTPSVPTQSVFGQCGGIGWTGPTLCRAPAFCCFNNKYESQCLPSSHASPGNALPSTTTLQTTTVKSVPPSPTSSTPTQPVFGQCGGVGWTGPTVCRGSAFCCFLNRYESQCLPAGNACPGNTLTSTPTTLIIKTTMTTTSAAYTTTASSGVPLWGMCGGKTWTGPTTCLSPAICCKSNEWFSQCLPASYAETWSCSSA